MKKVLCSFLLCFPLIAAAQDTTKMMMIQTTGKLPFLKYGLGQDRLGGAKMTYLDTGIVMRVVDSVNTDYKVQLSAHHFAYIDKAATQWLPCKMPKPYYLTSSWRVYGDDRFDYVTISLDERLPYRSVQQISPARIVVDIFGATSNTNWISQFGSVKEIKNAWYEQIEDDVMRVFIELKHAQHWGYHIGYDSTGQKLVISVKRQPGDLKIRKLKIAIDAGHGGTNTGATGITSNIKEKEYTLKIAQAVNKLLKRKRVATYMTREKDTTLGMPERVEMLRSENPHLLISIHLNSSGNMTVKGTSTYYRYIGFRSLSQAILRRMLELSLAEAGNVGGFNFSLNGPTDYPNCLVEVAFLSNVEDEKRILDPRFHNAVAKKIYKGIKDWLKEMK
ncbi:N-acetylmuramoyl-L-alanine amidase [Agriterribacter sp.]|uniref:N-acetylmuramoyl-L-alanine amidase n=1 Tax=Agriterribacter sp. TaxID=2821509 RepID=UPI002C352B7B|nr:N-acetylmuramoyl-L-alanine amidase [Agriterribacter sp.]HRO44528.1 N-acetylmuramoyl-L-alanine amidase [Agriterribacter sp.]HRQ16446.1 N-acetylmuramoyl-L-alanine amidase [Agriterribacter sp.]